jgi:hypothetical protein
MCSSLYQNRIPIQFFRETLPMKSSYIVESLDFSLRRLNSINTMNRMKSAIEEDA